jgi:hypothetical protein
MSDKRTKEYSLSRALCDIDSRGVPGGIEAEHHAELARNWPFPGGKTSRFPSLFVPFSALAPTQRDLQVSLPNYGYEWIGHRDIVLGADLLIAPSIVKQAGATTLVNLKGDTQVPHVAALADPQFTSETGMAPNTQLVTGASNLVPKRLTSETLVSRQLLVQGQSFEMILRNDLARSFAWTLDYMALVGRGAGFFEPVGILSDPNVIVQPVTTPTLYSDMQVMRELVAEEGVDMASFG